MNRTLTAEQQAAVSSRGQVIVSASAGSGKTFVMIERLVSLILGGADVREVLAVTFTNKAAAQMRDRLRTALIGKLGECGEQERMRLKEQLKALPLAEISTIHAWCSRLVRTHFFLADVDPAFRIISPDDADGGLLSSRALDEVFENAYEEGSADFERLLSVYFRKKKDAKLKELVVSLYTAVRGRADYLEFLRTAGREDGFEDVCSYLAGDFRSRARYFAENARSEAEYAGQGSKTAAFCTAVAEAAEAVLGADTLFEMADLPAPKIPNAPRSTGLEGEALRRLKRAAALSAAVKDLYKELKKFDPEEEERRRYLDGQELSRALSGLILRYDEIYSRLKREAGALDYDDLEHCALKVLENDEARTALRERYRYIFVDEYQDVNPAQERILSLVGGEEVFLVGDAKQSIYGFRGSKSEYFVRKGKEFSCPLALTENFRSAPAVLEAVNRVFSRAMTEETCGIPYAEAPMRGGSRYGVHGGVVRFYRVEDAPKEREERGVYSVLNGAAPEKDAQAEMIAELIAREVGTEWFDADSGLVKPLGFGDIAVLVRKNTGDAERIVAALSENGIPVTTTSSVNVCDFWEARLLIDWLSYLDNAEQDIPFAGALLSRIGGFTEADLVEVRRRFPSPFTFRGACEDYAAKMCDGLALRLRAFREKTERYRALAQVRTAAEMIGLLLSEGLEAEIAAKTDGDARLRRVRRLAAEGNGTVNDFLHRLKTLSDRVDFSESGGERAVKVLTMHAAKGLEFPSVFLASLDAPFHADRDEVFCTDRFGFAPKSYDTESKTVYETVLRRASAISAEREELKGELNLLYVAMTRAKYRLHLLFSGKNTALSPQFAKRFSDFIDFSACADYFGEGEEKLREPLPRAALPHRADPALFGALKEAYRRPYPHEESTRLPVKSSATELLGTLREEEAPGERRAFSETASVEDGLAYHAFLENVRFGASAGEELCRMREEGILTEEQLSRLDGEKLNKILALPALSALQGKRIRREQKFLVLLPAREVYGGTAEDEVVFQGAIDLLSEDEEGYLILDYKYSGASAEYLKRHYAPQIALYKKAVARAEGVDERTIRAKLVNILGLYEIEM